MYDDYSQRSTLLILYLYHMKCCDIPQCINKTSYADGFCAYITVYTFPTLIIQRMCCDEYVQYFFRPFRAPPS